jgi:hypothetical protein
MSGGSVKAVSHGLAASAATFTAATSKAVFNTLNASLSTASATTARTVLRLLNASSAQCAAVTSKLLRRPINSQTATSSGSVSKRASVSQQAQTATMSGSTTKVVARLVNASLSSMSGVTQKLLSRTVSSAMSVWDAAVSGVSQVGGPLIVMLSASMATLSGSQSKIIIKNQLANLALMNGRTSKKVSSGVSAGMATFSPQVMKRIVKNIVSSTGLMTASVNKLVAPFVSASVSFAVALVGALISGNGPGLIAVALTNAAVALTSLVRGLLFSEKTAIASITQRAADLTVTISRTPVSSDLNAPQIGIDLAGDRD